MSHFNRMLRYIVPTAAVLACAACASLREEPARPAEFERNSLTGNLSFETAVGQTATASLGWSQWAGQPVTGSPTARAEAAATPALPNYRWCVARTGRRHGSDSCYDFVAGSLQCALDNPSAIRRSRDCTADAELPTSLAGTTGSLYVRAEDPVDPKLYTNTEVRTYTWTLLKPDLQPEDASETINGDVVRLGIRIDNLGPVDATDVVMRFDWMQVVDANSVAHPLTQPDLLYPEVPASVTAEQVIQIDTGPLNLARPFTLSISMIADPDDAIDESDESNNTLIWNHQFF